MPLYDFQCQTAKCAEAFEQYLPLDRYQERPPCPTCGGETDRLYLPQGTSLSLAEPVVVYRDTDGSYRFPGDTHGPASAKYDRLGLTRVELRGWADVRRFESQMSKRDRSEIARRVERQQAIREASTSSRRSDFWHRVKSMSNMGRDVAKAAMRQNDRKPGPKEYDSGFHIEAYSQTRSNRDRSRGQRD